ncbi:MAG: hypothetical protein QM270_09070, partial [Bacillota bacterium]|nr:hypothetical protein [Bacillota bacterium]
FQIIFWITLRFDQKRPLCGQDGEFSKSLFGLLFVLTTRSPQAAFSPCQPSSWHAQPLPDILDVHP